MTIDAWSIHQHYANQPVAADGVLGTQYVLPHPKRRINWAISHLSHRVADLTLPCEFSLGWLNVTVVGPLRKPFVLTLGIWQYWVRKQTNPLNCVVWLVNSIQNRYAHFPFYSKSPSETPDFRCNHQKWQRRTICAQNKTIKTVFLAFFHLLLSIYLSTTTFPAIVNQTSVNYISTYNSSLCDHWSVTSWKNTFGRY